MSKVEKYFLDDIENTIKEVTNLVKRNENTKGEFIEKKHELQAILNDLKKIKFEILTNSLPAKEERFLSYESFIMDWGVRHPLGRKLLDIATKYTYTI